MPVHFRNLAIAAVLLGVAPLAAVADETGVAPVVVAAPSAQHTVTLIQTRMQKAKLPSRTGLAALNPDGTTLWASRAYEPFMPASTMKVITATVALELLGKDWKPTTRVNYDESTGTLYLVGGGDTMLTSANLKTLAERTAAALAAINAKVDTLKLDDTLFPAPTVAPGVQSLQQPQEINPVRALMVDRRISMDSAKMAVQFFIADLANAGVNVAYAGRAKATGSEIVSFAGMRLQGALRTMLWYSDNDIAEAIFRLSAIAAGRSGSWADARMTAYEQLAKLGIATDRLALIDGSGLSRQNRLTAFALSDILRVALANERTSILRELLPTAGAEGTVRSRFHTKPSMCVQGSLKVKTGGLRDVVSLAGYAPLADGSYRPFAIVVNNLHSVGEGNRARHAIDALAASFSGC